MQKVVSVGILGLGSIGSSHARALGELDGAAQLRTFSGGSPARAAETGWAGATQVSPEDLVSDPQIDVVAICTPSDLHGRQAIGALEAGRHIVVEKPLALTVAEADRVVEMAADRGLVAAVMSQRRLEPEYAAVRELIEAGRLGQLRLAATHVHWWRDAEYYGAAPWRAATAAGGGSLMNQGVHNVDLLRWLCGPVEEVTAQYATLAHDIDAEDTTVATLRFATGALGMVSTSTATLPGSPATLALHFDRGIIVLGQGEIIRWDVDGVRAPVTTGEVPSGASDPAAIGIAGHVAQWRDVLAAIRDGRPPAITASDGAETVRLLRAIYHAAESGRTVRPAELS